MTISDRTTPLGNGWDWVLLSDVARLATGHTPDRTIDDYWNGGIPWISLTEIRDLDGHVADQTKLKVSELGIRHSSSVVLPAGTVCLSRTASIGFVTVMGAEMATSQDFVNWICGPRIDPGYLMRALMASRHYLRSLSAGSTHKTLYMRVAERFRVLLPPIEEQRRIAAILDKADELRAKRRAALVHLDSLPQSIFLDMFGMEGGDRVLPLSSVADVQGGLQLSGGRVSNPIEIKYLRVANVQRGHIDLEDVKSLRATGAEIARTRLVPGDVLVVEGHGNPLEIGRAAAWDGSIEPCVHQNHLIRVRPGPQVGSRYLVDFLNSDHGRRHLLKAANTTSGLNTISVSVVKSVPVSLPTYIRQVEYERSCQEVDSLRARVSEALTEADELFASLQHRAFSGQL